MSSFAARRREFERTLPSSRQRSADDAKVLHRLRQAEKAEKVAAEAARRARSAMRGR
jgi:hypothetical protein